MASLRWLSENGICCRLKMVYSFLLVQQYQLGVKLPYCYSSLYSMDFEGWEAIVFVLVG